MDFHDIESAWEVRTTPSQEDTLRLWASIAPRTICSRGQALLNILLSHDSRSLGETPPCCSLSPLSDWEEGSQVGGISKSRRNRAFIPAASYRLVVMSSASTVSPCALRKRFAGIPIRHDGTQARWRVRLSQ